MLIWTIEMIIDSDLRISGSNSYKVGTHHSTFFRGEITPVNRLRAHLVGDRGGRLGDDYTVRSLWGLKVGASWLLQREIYNTKNSKKTICVLARYPPYHSKHRSQRTTPSILFRRPGTHRISWLTGDDWVERVFK